MISPIDADENESDSFSNTFNRPNVLGKFTNRETSNAIPKINGCFTLLNSKVNMFIGVLCDANLDKVFVVVKFYSKCTLTHLSLDHHLW